MSEEKDELGLESVDAPAVGAAAAFVRPGELLGALKASAGINPTRGLFVGKELRVPKEGDDEDFGSMNEGRQVDSLTLLRELMPEVEWEKVAPGEVVGVVRENVHDIALIVVRGADIGSVRAGCVEMPENVALLPDLSAIVDTSKLAIAPIPTITTAAGLRTSMNEAFYRRIDFLRNVGQVREAFLTLKEAMKEIARSLERVKTSIPRTRLNELRAARIEAGQHPLCDEDFDPMMEESSQGVERVGFALDQFQETLPVLDVSDLGHHVRNPLGFLVSNLDTLIADISSAELEVPGIMTETRATLATFQEVVRGIITRFQDN